jgi:hypothetical protein
MEQQVGLSTRDREQLEKVDILRASAFERPKPLGLLDVAAEERKAIQ